MKSALIMPRSLLFNPKIQTLCDTLEQNQAFRDSIIHPHAEDDYIQMEGVVFRHFAIGGLFSVCVNALDLMNRFAAVHGVMMLRDADLRTLDHMAGGIPGFGAAMVAAGFAAESDNGEFKAILITVEGILFPNPLYKEADDDADDEIETDEDDDRKRSARERARKSRERKKSEATGKECETGSGGDSVEQSKPTNGGWPFEITKDVLTDPEKVAGLYRHAVTKGWVAHSETTQRGFESVAEQAASKGRNPAALFTSMVKSKKWEHPSTSGGVTDASEQKAIARRRVAQPRLEVLNGVNLAVP